MTFHKHATPIWFFALLFGVIAGAGDGLHFLPGCGHTITIPGGTLYVGIPGPGEADLPGVQPTAISRPRGGDVTIPGGASCPICQHFSQASCPATTADLILGLPGLQGLPTVVAPELHLDLVRAFHGRAPPQA
jgi:hypothetical protein